jgi:DNA polymerase type B, organellar and viral
LSNIISYFTTSKEKIASNNIDLEFQNYKHHKLPITMNPLEYGKLIEQDDNKFTVQVNKTNIAIIRKYELFNEVKFFKEGKIAYIYKDYKIDDNTFIRSIENKKYTFKNKNVILLTIDKSVNFIKLLILNNKLNNKIISFDIETYVKDGIMIPFVVSWYDGENKSSYFIKDFKDHVDMIKSALNDIMVKKYDNYQVYIHNLAKFDGVFLLKILTELGKIKPIIHNKDLISIGFKFNNYNITFKDSLQILIVSLRNLGKTFGVLTQKSIFPYTFVNENNLDYIGPVPDFKYFNNISKNEYNEYKSKFNNNWCLRNEVIKYCEDDVISLYQILIKFNTMIFDLFKLTIQKYPTLSSLAFAIFRTHFLRKDEIPQLSGQIEKDIRSSYTGGAVDMYLPRLPKGEKMFCYDVNSLYPYVMKEFDMPTGKPIKFFGDIRKYEPDAFGFFYCKITTPDNLKHPILQTHVKINKGIRTVAPLGKWENMIFSREMDNAKKYGYKFEILWGYKFKPKNIFKSYVETLYDLRLKFPKSNPLNLIAKLLLNSLYGRFGMNDSFPNITIFKDLKSFKKWYNIHNEDVIKFVGLGDRVLVEHRSELKDKQTELYYTLETHNVSINIASAITAYARIHMSQFKNNHNFNLYYSDTDSIYIDRPLSEHLVNSKVLGLMKLEYILVEAIFLAPKVYYLETEDGKTIYKVKGLKHEIELTKNDFEKLLVEQSILGKFQNKWIKNLSDGNIEVRNELYTLKVTDNKRQLIYNENNELINSNPYIINNDKIIN